MCTKTTTTDATARLYAAVRTNDPRRAMSRVVALGEGQTCSRCCGGGHYSYCQMYGTTCFKCGGRGTVAPKITHALCERIEARVAAGELDAYLERCTRIRNAKRLPDALLSMWGAIPVVAADKGLHFMKCTPMHHAINRAASALYDACNKAATAIAYDDKLNDEQRDALAGRCGLCVGLIPTIQSRIESRGVEVTAENYAAIGEQIKAEVLAELA